MPGEPVRGGRGCWSLVVFRITFGIKRILYLYIKQFLKILNNCNRLSYKMFESRRRAELGHHSTILLEIGNFHARIKSLTQ